MRIKLQCEFEGDSSVLIMRIKLQCEFEGDDIQVSLVHVRGAGPHFSRNSSISGWFNRARQQSRWIFITNKWTSEIGDNSALIHGPLNRNRVTRKDNNTDYRSNHSHGGRTWGFGQYFMDRRLDNHRVQSTIDAGCLGYGSMVKNNNCRNSTICQVRILHNYFFLVVLILMSA